MTKHMDEQRYNAFPESNELHIHNVLRGTYHQLTVLIFRTAFHQQNPSQVIYQKFQLDLRLLLDVSLI